jgi:hypothetical protein
MMLVKVVLVFLVFMAGLAVFGRLRFPGGTPRLPGQPRLSSGKCPKCGRPLIGKGPCDCSKGTT